MIYIIIRNCIWLTLECSTSSLVEAYLNYKRSWRVGKNRLREHMTTSGKMASSSSLTELAGRHRQTHWEQKLLVVWGYPNIRNVFFFPFFLYFLWLLLLQPQSNRRRSRLPDSMPTMVVKEKEGTRRSNRWNSSEPLWQVPEKRGRRRARAFNLLT